MNKSQLPKLKHKRMRVRPQARRFDESGRELGYVDDTWLVTDASEDGLTLQNVRTHHNVTLNPDNIHKYQSDPSGDRDGFLVLDLQLFLQGNRVRYEPLDPRGNVTFIPVDRIQEGPPLDTEEKDLLVSCLSSNDGLLHIFDAEQLVSCNTLLLTMVSLDRL